ncbi:hypothetical protein PDL04_26695 [Bacillus cereus group sp. BY142LC]|uniref:hypothetical protein n=1 Tax=Bacillus cereus group sp. BY142LC TaxID=3018083 RepID=UPI0022E6E9D4|nr:hypothetical protein [Bacillus cereus group sp. BY142LC]MDA1835040.1 hypothetical protein [Bacillus cereus group sp. BY142LC]
MEPHELLKAMDRENPSDYYNEELIKGIDGIINVIRAEYKVIISKRSKLEKKLINDNEGIEGDKGNEWHELSSFANELSMKESMIQTLVKIRNNAEAMIKAIKGLSYGRNEPY